MQLLKERKTRIIILLILLAIISSTFGFYYKFKWNEFRTGGDSCYLWVKNAENGRGFGFPANYLNYSQYFCNSLKNHCNDINNFHNLPCVWIDSKILIDKEGNQLGKNVAGCECSLIQGR